MFYPYARQPGESAGAGVTRKILARGGSLMMTEVAFEKGSVGVIHMHPHEQVSYIRKGRFTYHLGDETLVLGEGDSCYCAPNTPHGVEALEDGIIIDIFTPQREDFLRK